MDGMLKTYLSEELNKLSMSLPIFIKIFQSLRRHLKTADRGFLRFTMNKS